LPSVLTSLNDQSVRAHIPPKMVDPSPTIAQGFGESKLRRFADELSGIAMQAGFRGLLPDMNKPTGLRMWFGLA